MSGWPVTFLGMVIGGSLGMLVVGLVGLVIEVLIIPWVTVPGQIQLSHGQQFAWVTLPIAGLQGSAAGLAIAFRLQSRTVLAVTTSIVSAVVLSLFVIVLWNNDVKKYGQDTSQIVLYVPLLLESLTIFVYGIFLTRYAAKVS